MKADSITYFIVVMVLMISSILYLSGCTQFDKSDRKQKEWNLVMESPNDGGCYLRVDVRADDEVADDTVEFTHPAGGK